MEPIVHITLAIKVCLIIPMTVVVGASACAEAATQKPRQGVLDTNHKSVHSVFARKRPIQPNVVALRVRNVDTMGAHQTGQALCLRGGHNIVKRGRRGGQRQARTSYSFWST